MPKGVPGMPPPPSERKRWLILLVGGSMGGITFSCILVDVLMYSLADKLPVLIASGVWLALVVLAFVYYWDIVGRGHR